MSLCYSCKNLDSFVEIPLTGSVSAKWVDLCYFSENQYKVGKCTECLEYEDKANEDI